MEKIAQTLRKTPDKIIFVCSSPYNILIAASLIMKADLYGRCALILPTYSPKNINYFKEIIHKMEQTGVICEVINKRNMLYRAVGLSDRENRVIMERVLKKLHTKKHEFFLVNHTWNKALVCYPACLWFRYCKQTIFIEEGSSQRATPDENPLILWMKKLYGNQRNFWKDGRLKGIYVGNRELFAEYPMRELKQFTLNVEYSREEKKKLIDLFAGGRSRTEIQRLKEAAHGIIYTQPLSEDGYVKEEEKIEIYNSIVNYYSKYGKVVVKIHPRDTTHYDFPEDMILEGGYPSELLNILGIRFRFAIGICTSAIETAEAEIKINLNDNFLKDGKCELVPLDIR